MIPFNDLTPIRDDVHAAIETAVTRVVRSGTFLRGPETDRFERDWAAYCGQRYCVGLANGTDALTLIAKACGLTALEVPAITCWYTADGLYRGGCQPLPVDIGPRGHLVTPHPGAICVPLYGSLPTPDESNRCTYFDAAQAHGWQPPTHAIVAWSFYPTKTLGAMGDCGAVTCNDSSLANELRMLAGRDDLFRDRRQIVSRIDEIQAAILAAKLPFLDEWIAAKRQIAVWYQQHLPNDDRLHLVYSPEESHLYCLAVHAKHRNLLAAFLLRNEVQTKTHYPTPLHKYSAFWEGPRGRSLPVAERWCNSVLSLPCWPGMQESQVVTICQFIAQFYRDPS